MRIFAKLNKIQRISLAVIALVLLCRMAGVTKAWFVSEDSVVNHFLGHEYYVDIALIEPNWDSVGRTQAAAMQPGMDIFKDPRVVNIAEDRCIVRMKIEISVGGTDLDKDSEAYKAIMSSVAYYTGGGVLRYDDLSGCSGYNTDAFTYYDGSYYYTYYDQDKGGDYCVQLESLDSTPPLFTDVVIPYWTEDYAYFKDGFSIKVIAEAMFSVSDSYTVAEAAARFDGVDDETDDETNDETTDDPVNADNADDTEGSAEADSDIAALSVGGETKAQAADDNETEAEGAELNASSLDSKIPAAGVAPSEDNITEDFILEDISGDETADSGERIAVAESVSGFGAESTATGSALEVE